MFKKSEKLIGICLVLLLVFFVAGCGKATPTTANSDLKPNQAAELVYHDLTYHGVGVDKVDVTGCVFKDSKTALVDVTYQTVDGKSISQKVTIIKKNGKWLIEEHDH